MDTIDMKDTPDLYDYKKILTCYIRHVGDVEGITFIEANNNVEGLTVEENEELRNIDEILSIENNQ